MGESLRGLRAGPVVRAETRAVVTRRHRRSWKDLRQCQDPRRSEREWVFIDMI